MLVVHISYADIWLKNFDCVKEFSEFPEKSAKCLWILNIYDHILLLFSKTLPLCFSYTCQFIPCVIAICILVSPTACKLFEVMIYTSSIFECPIIPIPEVSKCLWNGWIKKNDRQCYFYITIPDLNWQIHIGT